MKNRICHFTRTHLMEILKTYRWVVTESFIEKFKAFENEVNSEASNVTSGEDGLLIIWIAEAVTSD